MLLHYKSFLFVSKVELYIYSLLKVVRDCYLIFASRIWTIIQHFGCQKHSICWETITMINKIKTICFLTNIYLVAFIQSDFYVLFENIRDKTCVYINKGTKYGILPPN